MELHQLPALLTTLFFLQAKLSWPSGVTSYIFGKDCSNSTKNFLWLPSGVTQQQKNSVGHVQIAENMVKHRVWCLIFLICQIYFQNDVLFNKQKKIKDITLTIIKCVIPLWQKALCSTHPQVLYYIIYRRKRDIPFEIMWGSLEILIIFHSFAWATFQLFGKLQLLFVSLSFIADLLWLPELFTILSKQQSYHPSTYVVNSPFLRVLDSVSKDAFLWDEPDQYLLKK